MPGPHGFAVRDGSVSSSDSTKPNAGRPHAVSAHGQARPATTTRAQRCRVHRNLLQRSRRRPTPLLAEQDGRIVRLIWVRREAECFFGRDWTGEIALIWLRKLGWGRRKIAANPRRNRCTSLAMTRSLFVRQITRPQLRFGSKFGGSIPAARVGLFIRARARVHEFARRGESLQRPAFRQQQRSFDRQRTSRFRSGRPNSNYRHTFPCLGASRM